MKAEKKSRSSKRRLDVNLRKRTRADCRACSDASVSREHTVFTKQHRGDFHCKLTRERNGTHFSRWPSEKTAEGSTPRLSPENCFLHKFGRGASVIASVTSGPHSQANGERRPTLELQSHLSSCACTLRRERGNEDSKWFKHSQTTRKHDPTHRQEKQVDT